MLLALRYDSYAKEGTDMPEANGDDKNGVEYRFFIKVFLGFFFTQIMRNLRYFPFTPQIYSTKNLNNPQIKSTFLEMETVLDPVFFDRCFSLAML
jgi:hypothetical protein